MGVEMQLFECCALKPLRKVWRKDKWRIDCIYWLCKWSQWIASVQSKCSKIPPSTSMHFSTLLATVRVAVLRSSWHSCFMRVALFIMRATNSSLMFAFSLQTSLFIHPHRQKSDMYSPTSNSCNVTPIENLTTFIWTYLLGIVHTTTF